MTKECKLMGLGLLVVMMLVAKETFADTPFITLYRGRNMTDYHVQLNSSLWYLGEVDLINQIHSYRYHGNFILYDYPDYNERCPSCRYVPMANTEDTKTTEGTDASLVSVYSVRFIGSYLNGSHVPSITLFNSIKFAGLFEERITGSKSELDIVNIISAVSVGVSDWTFYDEVDFGGEGLCLKGSSNHTGVKYYPDTRGDVNLWLKRSVEVGCWVRHGVPLEL